MPVTCSQSTVKNIFAHARSGIKSSRIGSWSVSLLRTWFNKCGSIHILRAPDFLVAMTTLLTHAVGSSTFASTPRLSSQSSLALNFSLRAVRTQCEGMTEGSASSSICRCTVLGRVQRFFKNTSAWHWTSLSTVSTFLISLNNCTHGGGTVTKLFKL